MKAVALTIAGSDPSGGAGVQADLKTFHQHGVFGTSVLTLLTVQNTVGVEAVRGLETDFVMAQLEAVLADVPPAAAKTGALGSAAVIEAVGARAAAFDFPLVVDPVMISKHGHALIEPDAVAMLRRELLPRAFLLTPNAAEAEALTGVRVRTLTDMEQVARRLADLGPRHVLVKGGRGPGSATDVLWSEGQLRHFIAPRIATEHTHGSGCVFSAAITAWLAREIELVRAIELAKQFVTRAIASAPGLGRGRGPLDLHVDVD